MNFPILECLKDISEHLKPILKQTGLRPKVGTVSLTPEYDAWAWDFEPKLNICFTDSRGANFSPVEIDLKSSIIEGGKPSLSGATKRVFEWVVSDLADSGWRYYHNERFDEEPLGQGNEGFEQIGMALLAYAKIPFIRDTTKASHDNGLATIMSVMEDNDGLFGEPKLRCERRDGVESIVFKDSRHGETWRFAVSGKGAVLYIDDKPYGNCNSYDRSSVRELLVSTWHTHRPALDLKPR